MFITDPEGNQISLQAKHAKIVVLDAVISIAGTPATAGYVLYVGATGDLNVVTLGGETVLFPNVQPGMFPVLVTQVNSSNTTIANTSLIALA